MEHMRVFLICAAIALALAVIGSIIAWIVRTHLENKRDPEHKKGFKEWWHAHKPSKRRLIQIYAARPAKFA